MAVCVSGHDYFYLFIFFLFYVFAWGVYMGGGAICVSTGEGADHAVVGAARMRGAGRPRFRTCPTAAGGVGLRIGAAVGVEGEARSV